MLIEKADFKILLVDDEESICDTVTQTLTISGFRRITALPGGQEALSLFSKESFDLVFTDYDMSPVRGDRVAAGALEADPEQSIIVISGSLSEDELERFSQIGVRECIRKPFRINDIITAAEGVLADVEKSLSRKADLSVLNESAETTWRERGLRPEEQRGQLLEALESGRRIGLPYRELWLIAVAFLARDLEDRHKPLAPGGDEIGRLRSHIESSPETVIHTTRLSEILRVSGFET